MTRAEKLLASRLLDLASDEFHEHGCNDMPKEMFAGISEAEVKEMVAGWNKFNEFEGDPLPLMNIGDDGWMEYLAHRLAEDQAEGIDG
jgi:hypothetical protein